MSEDAEYLRIRVLIGFHYGANGVDYGQGSIVNVPAQWAQTWEKVYACEILGKGKPPGKPKPPKVIEPPPKRKVLTGFIVDDMLREISAPTVRVRVVEYAKLNDGTTLLEGHILELSKETARSPLISGHCILLGEGKPAEPSAEARIHELETELSQLKSQQAQTQKAVQNVDILLHPTGDDKLSLRKKRRR